MSPTQDLFVHSYIYIHSYTLHTYMYFSSSSPLYSSSTLYFTLLPPRVVIPLYLSVTCATTLSLFAGCLPDRVCSRFPLWVSPSLTSTLPQRVRVTISLSRSPTPVLSLSVGSLVSATCLATPCSLRVSSPSSSLHRQLLPPLTHCPGYSEASAARLGISFDQYPVG